MSKPDVPVLPEGVEQTLMEIVSGCDCDPALPCHHEIAHRRAIAAAILRAKADSWEAAGDSNMAALGRAQADALEKERTDA